MFAADKPKGKATKPPKEKKSDPSNGLFATNAPILTFKVTVKDGEWAALNKDNRSYVRGTVQVGTNVYPDVAVRLKGNGSFRPLNEKPSMVFKFDHYVPDQKFLGETKIALNSSSQDGTYLADFMANGLFADANVPVSRVTHARVELNGRALGLYVLVEVHNKEFLKRWFHNSSGSLYEAYLADVDSNMDQDNGEDRTQKDRKRLAEVVDLTKNPDPTKRWERLPEVLDVDRYLSHLACEIFTSHTDGYAMNRNNYRIYQNPDTGKFTFIGHGVDWGFQNTGVSITPPRNALVARAVLDNPWGRKEFNERFGTLFTNIFRLEVLTNRVNVAVARLVSQAQSTNEIKDFQRYGAEMNSRLVGRWQFITNKLYGPPPLQLAFDREGSARLSGWSKKTDPNSKPAAQERAIEGSRHILHITVTNACIASWRTRVFLEPGKYSFEGELRGAGIVALTNKADIDVGAGLRMSGGHRTNNFVIGDAPWRRFAQDITIEVGDAAELVCELRAQKGDVWFDEDSLRIIRKEK